MARNSFDVELGLRDRNFVNGLNRSQRRLRAFAQNIDSVTARRLGNFSRGLERAGRTLTRSFSLPLAAAGAASARFALDFERNLTRVSTLTGVSRREVDRLGESLFALTSNSGLAADQLAEGLLVAVSAGFRATEAIELTDSAARLSAIGFGELDTITRALTVTVENYAGANVSAAEAGDVLLATAQAGNFQVSQLGDVFGRLLASSNALGVSLPEVSAGFATLTRNTGSATEAQTQLSAILTAFLKPSASAAAAYSRIGLSIDEVRDSLGANGLQATLQVISDRLEAAGIDLTQVFGRAEAVKGILALTAESTSFHEVLGTIEGSVGEVRRQSEAWAETNEGRLQISLGELRNASIEFGSEILPAVSGALENVAGNVSSLAQGFGGLNESTQNAVLGFGALTAAAPLAATAVGRLGTSFVNLQRNLVAGRGLLPALAGSAGLVGTLGAVTVGGGLLLSTLYELETPITDQADLVARVTQAWQDQTDAVRDATEAYEAFETRGSNVVGSAGESLPELPTQDSLREFARAEAERQGRIQGIDFLDADTGDLAFELAVAAEFDEDRIRELQGDLSTRFRDDLAVSESTNPGPEIFDTGEFGRSVSDLFRAGVAAVSRRNIGAELITESPAARRLFDQSQAGLSGDGEGLFTTGAERRVTTDLANEELTSARDIALGLGAVFEEFSDPAEVFAERLDDIFQERNAGVAAEELERINSQFADTGDVFTYIGQLQALADTYGIDLVNSAEDASDALDDTTESLDDQTTAGRRTTAAINAQSNALNRLRTTSISLRRSLGLDDPVLEREASLQALVEAEAEAAFLAAGNDINIDPDSGLLDEYNALTIQAVEDWFSSIDRYVQSLGSTGEFAAIESVIDQQTAAVERLQDSLPEDTYQRLLERLQGIETSGLNPGAQSMNVIFPDAEARAREVENIFRNLVSRFPILANEYAPEFILDTFGADQTVEELFAGRVPELARNNPALLSLSAEDAYTVLDDFLNGPDGVPDRIVSQFDGDPMLAEDAIRELRDDIFANVATQRVETNFSDFANEVARLRGLVEDNTITAVIDADNSEALRVINETRAALAALNLETTEADRILRESESGNFLPRGGSTNRQALENIHRDRLNIARLNDPNDGDTVLSRRYFDFLREGQTSLLARFFPREQEIDAQELAFLRSLPQLAEGGIITRPTALIAGEAGDEAIVPLDGRTGLGGTTVNNFYIDGTLVGTVEDLAEQIEAIQRSNVRVGL